MERLGPIHVRYNTAALSTLTQLAPKPAQNTLKHAYRLEVIGGRSGHAFWDHRKADEELWLLSITV